MELGVVYQEIQRARYLRHASMSLYRDLHVVYMFNPLLMLFVDQLYANQEAFVPYYLAHALVLLVVFSAITGSMNCPSNDGFQIYKGSGPKARQQGRNPSGKNGVQITL
jgi:hypothetical protein